MVLRWSLLCRSGQAQVDVPLQFERGVGHEFSPELEQSANMRLRREPFSQRYSGEQMEFHFKFCNHPEIAASPTQSPEQVRIFPRIGTQNLAVCCYQRE